MDDDRVKMSVAPHHPDSENPLDRSRKSPVDKGNPKRYVSI